MTTILAAGNGEHAWVKDWKTDPNLTPQVKQFLSALNTSGPALETLPVIEAQNVLVKAQASVDVDYSGIEISEKTITKSGYTVKLYIVKPEGVSEKLPAFLFIHGGGWVLGDFPTHKRMVRDLVVLSGKACVFVEYTRTPEARYPIALNEIYAALEWVAKNGNQINVDGNNLAIVGNSAGGNMATVTAIKAKENNGPEIKLQILLWPVADSNFDTESYLSFAEDRFLTRNIMMWMYDLYVPNPEERKAIYVSPLQASVQQLQGLPPTLIQTAENDVLRDEGEAYGRKLAEAGVNVTTVRYNGVIHDFGLLNGLAHLPETKTAFVQATAELKKYLW